MFFTRFRPISSSRMLQPVNDKATTNPAEALSQAFIGRPADSDRPHNRLLDALDADDLAYLQPHLESIDLAVNDVLAEAGEHFRHVYFPQSAAISIVTYMADGSGVEVGTTGNEGMAGLPAYLEADASESRTFCQVKGTSFRVPVDVMIRIAADRPAIRRLLNRYTHAYMSMVAQGAACNRLHTIEQRCARWLLMTHDRIIGPDEVMELKQEFLALMLGVRRIGVTIAAGALQDAGMIKYRRGRIRVLDRAGLEAAACECYGVVRRRFDTLGASWPAT